MAKIQRINIRVDDEDRYKLRALSVALRRSRASVIRILIDEAYKRVEANTAVLEMKAGVQNERSH